MARNFCILIILAINLLSSEEFILWAKISTQNQRTTYENLSVSKAMVITKLESDFLCEIDEAKTPSQTALEYLNLHKDKLFDCFISQKFRVQDYYKHYYTPRGINLHTNTVLTLLPIRFTIKFKPNSAIIGVFNDKKEL